MHKTCASCFKRSDRATMSDVAEWVADSDRVLTF